MGHTHGKGQLGQVGFLDQGDGALLEGASGTEVRQSRAKVEVDLLDQDRAELDVNLDLAGRDVLAYVAAKGKEGGQPREPRKPQGHRDRDMEGERTPQAGGAGRGGRPGVGRE
jgi:hypothetical protein